jgi:translin
VNASVNSRQLTNLTVVTKLSLKDVLGKIQEELRKREIVHEEVQRNMRRATRLSKQAILFTHQERFIDARKLLTEAEELFSKLRKVSRNYPDMFYSGMVDAAFQEYAEAHTLLCLIKEDEFVDPEELKIPSISYVLGLADVIGELRRRALDSLRKGDVKTAEKCLQTMEQIYVELMAMDEAYMLVPGLRRKSDVARHVIESSRGDITIEARRSTLEDCMKNLEKIVKLQKKKR